MKSALIHAHTSVLSEVEAEDVAEARSPISASVTFRPLPCASRAMLSGKTAKAAKPA